MRFGAKGLMSTLMRVRISSDAPRCTVQFGALDPRCTMVQVHGDPNEPSLGAGAAGAPCVTLRAVYAVYAMSSLDTELSLRHRTQNCISFVCCLCQVVALWRTLVRLSGERRLAAVTGL